MIEHSDRKYFKPGHDATAHRWDTRRCIDFPRYRSPEHARLALRMMHYNAVISIIPCAWCAHLGVAWHAVFISRSFLGGWSPVQYLENLPPLFEQENADPSRYGFNH